MIPIMRLLEAIGAVVAEQNKDHDKIVAITALLLPFLMVAMAYAVVYVVTYPVWRPVVWLIGRSK